MKKLLTLLTAAAMLLSVSVTAFAEAGNETNNGSAATSITVKGTYTKGSSATEVISVDIAWGAMKFNYTDESEGTWDPATHQYIGKAAAKWENVKDENGDPTNKISVTNHSNTKVNAVMTFTKAEGTDIEGSFDKAKLTLDSAEGKTVENAPTAEAVFNVTGGSITADATIGTITVNISDYILVSTPQELCDASNAGGKIRLLNDIDMGSNRSISVKNITEIDLNGHTITNDSTQRDTVWVDSGNCTLKNGTIINKAKPGRAIFNSNGTIRIENCLVQVNNNGFFAFENSNGTATIVNSRFEGTDNKVSNNSGTIIVLAGTYNFDPTEYVDADTYTVTTNTDGTWTVAAK